MNIIVIGAGAWGTALAIQAAGRHSVTLWARADGAAAVLARDRVNTVYLPGVALPAALGVRAVLSDRLEAGSADLNQADLVVIATPAGAAPAWLAALQASPALRAGTPVVWLCKGLVWREGEAELLHEVAARVAPELRVGALSGPSFAQEVAAGLPCALVAASTDAQVRDVMVAAFHGARLRVYANADLTGVELGGAVKNVLAIAAGVSDGLNLGLNARAALLTRGLAEMTRLGLAMGAKAETFMGLSGMGDLLLTATGDLSRNRRVGLALAGGAPLSTIVAQLGHVAEGVLAAPAVLKRARALGVSMPVTQVVNQMLHDGMPALAAMQRLLDRERQTENPSE